MNYKLQSLKVSAKELYQQYCNDTDNYEISIDSDFNISNGLINISCHSKLYKDIEFKLLTRNICEDDEIIILFGLGDGEILKYISEKFHKVKRVIVIEPSISIFRAAFDNLDIDSLFNLNYNISFLISKDYDEVNVVLMLALGEYQALIKIIKISSEMVLFKEYFDTIELEIIENIRRIRIDFSTKQYWKIAWIKNVLFNIANNKSTVLMNDNNSLQGESVFIVGAGPSIDNDLDSLRKVTDKGYIFTVGTGSRILHVNNIKSDYRFVIDGEQVLKNLSDSITDNGLPLVYSNKVNSKLMDKFKGKKIEIVLDLDNISKYIYDSVQIDYKEIKSAYTVAQIAIDVAVKMGAKRIIMLGMDCAYTQNRLHAENDGEELIESKNINMSFDDPKYIKTVDKYGDIIYTDIPLMGTKLLTEKLIKQHSNVEFINSGSGGLSFKGARDISLDKLFADEIKCIKKCEIFDSIEMDPNQKIEIFKNGFDPIYTIYSELESKIDEFNVEKSTMLSRDFLETLKKEDFNTKVLKHLTNNSLVANYYDVNRKGKSSAEDIQNQITIIGESIHIIKSSLELMGKDNNGQIDIQE